MKANIINCTPHAIVVNSGCMDPEDSIYFPPSGHIGRVKVETKFAFDLNGIPVATQVFGEIEGLPEPVDGTFLVVSGLVLAANKANVLIGIKPRNDLIGPDTGPSAIRDENGRISAVRGFVI